MTFEAALRAVFDELGLAPESAQIAGLCAHFELLQRWNRRVNLTTITDASEAARRHFGEAAFLHRALPAMAAAVDVGSGGGFPGLPFAVLRPATTVTLVESKRKKASFLRMAACSQPNVSVCECRIGDWSGRAEWALLRAVAPASVLPALGGCCAAVAVLGTRRPPSGPFGPWRDRPMPWSGKRRLWTAVRR